MKTLWSTALRATMAAFRALGLGVDRILADAGVEPGLLEDPDARIGLERTALVWPAAQRQWQRPGLGLHAGAALPAGSMAVLEYAVATGASVRDALERVSEGFAVVSEGVTNLRLEEQDSTVVVVFSGVYPEQVRDYVVTGLHRLFRRYGVAIEAVRFAGGAFDSTAAYRALLEVAVEFDTGENAIVVPRRAMSDPITAHLPGLRALIGEKLAQLLSQVRQERAFTATVARAVALLLPTQDLSLDAVARKLGMSPRTLQRRLAEQGSSLSAMVEETRSELAARYLESGRLPVVEIAYLLGYSEPSAFTRAFRRWRGHSPTAYRDAFRHGAK